MDESPQRITGRVKFYSVDKGFGFIHPDNGGKDVFVHRTGFVDGIDVLIAEQKVSFVVCDSDRKGKGDGKRAMDVMVV